MSKNINQTEDPNCVAPNSSQTKDKGLALLKYVLIGTVFGIVFVKAEIISWFRIQEMFRLQSFHMFGVIGSAIVTGIISIQLIKRLNIKTIHGEAIIIPTKEFKKRPSDWWFYIWIGMGDYRSLPRTLICSNRQWLYGHPSNSNFSSCRYLVVWQV